ncbi:pentatricopeptide repeat-containing protein At1g43980, mitochondrial [Rutidosis leptorrhynchoides]|uniref:pentatricopeptide repeat-containing protein At1g43980, mitochondrial n=1 Tax=Rutidosis leptorrhynchoides TaxID=125765 RepID=UPI003A9A3719
MVCCQRSNYFSTLLNRCLSLKSLYSVKIVHAQLIKLSLCNTNTFLGNRCLDLYTKLGKIQDAFGAFNDIRYKNVYSWNLYMQVFIQFGDIEGARQVFDEMPERDVVSWNSIISAYGSNGFVDHALDVFVKMQSLGVTPSGYTYSIVLSCVRYVCNGMEVHCNMIRNGLDFKSVIIGNSLIDMYCKHGFVDYAFGVFINMEEIDIISWNSLITGCSKFGYEEMAYHQLCIMRSKDYVPDAFTVSSVLTACSTIQDLSKGKQIFCLSLKSGFLSNTIVLSAAINMFSKCESIYDPICILDEIDNWDSAVSNSMISSLINHRLEKHAMQIFVLSLNEGVGPTEFTLSCLLSCASMFVPAVQGTMLHCFVVKLGFESDPIVSSSLVEMYSKLGFFNSAKIIFDQMDEKDLISWNSMILGCSYNGKTIEALKYFDELLKTGVPPDEITLLGVLLACNYSGLIDKGLTIFYSMEREYGVKPTETHFNIIVEMMIRAGNVNEAFNIITTMGYSVNGFICKLILSVNEVRGDLELTEKVAERLMKLEPTSALPYVALCKAYEVWGRWESVARVKKLMKDRNIRKVVGCSWIGVNSGLFDFKEDEVVNHGGEDVYLIMRLLMHDIEDEGYVF